MQNAEQGDAPPVGHLQSRLITCSCVHSSKNLSCAVLQNAEQAGASPLDLLAKKAAKLLKAEDHGLDDACISHLAKLSAYNQVQVRAGTVVCGPHWCLQSYLAYAHVGCPMKRKQGGAAARAIPEPLMLRFVMKGLAEAVQLDGNALCSTAIECM